MKAYRVAGRYRWWLIAALAVLFLLMASFEASILPNQVSSQCKQPDQSGKEYCSGYAVALAFTGNIVDALTPYENLITALSGAAVAIFTFTLWLTTRQMWRASTLQLRHSEETARRQLRAYVMVEHARIVDLKEGCLPKADLIIKNTGQTPAYNVSHWCFVGFETFPLTGPIPGMDEDEVLMPQRPLSPNGEIHIGAIEERRLSAGTLAELKAGTHALYVVGQIRYEDAFNRKQETDFVLISGGPIPADGSLGCYHEGNRAT